MSRMLVLFESAQIPYSEAALAVCAGKGEVQKIICSFGGREIQEYLEHNQATEIHRIFIPAQMTQDPNFIRFLETHPSRNQCVFIENPEEKRDPDSPLYRFTRMQTKDLEDQALLETVLAATSARRAPGIRSFLAKGSTIYSENLFSSAGIGAKLDSCFPLVVSHVGETRAMNVWSVLNLFILHAFTSLNQYMSENSNKRVKLQLGVDQDKLCMSVSFPVTDVTFKDLYFGLEELYAESSNNSWLASWKEACFLEVSSYQASSRGEIITCFDKNHRTQNIPFVVRNVVNNDLESLDDAKEYSYRLIGAIKAAADEGDTKVIVGAKPKIKLSERMKSITEKHGSASQKTVIKGVTDRIGGVKTVIKGASTEKEKSVTIIKGSSAEQDNTVTTIKSVTEHVNDSVNIKITAGESPANTELRIKATSPETSDSAEEADLSEDEIIAGLTAIVDKEEEAEAEATAPAAQSPSSESPAGGADENSIINAIAGMVDEIEGKKSGETIAETLKAETAPAGASAKDPKADVTPKNPAAEQNPEVAKMLSPAEQEKLSKLYSIDSVRQEKDPVKLLAILEDRLKSAKDVIAQREVLIQKLYKQIEEIMDPSRSAVISGVLDTQREGLKQNIVRLEDELKEADKREKTLMTAVDKATQAKDDAIKKLKALELKAQSAEQALKTKLDKVEKILEEEKRQKAELAKKLSSPKAA